MEPDGTREGAVGIDDLRPETATLIVPLKRGRGTVGDDETEDGTDAVAQTSASGKGDRYGGLTQ